MDKPALQHLTLDQLRQHITAHHHLDADYHALRRECLRRAEGWGKLANYAGCSILFLLALILWNHWFLG